jgi:hypothetical protein
MTLSRHGRAMLRMDEEWGEGTHERPESGAALAHDSSR